ncbi:molybdopterin-dependent oxidoreductase [Defluviicoccus vanus]|nr:molybdopterin-dependent oxidoreductase [Defluviicoccus vanus]
MLRQRDTISTLSAMTRRENGGKMRDLRGLVLAVALLLAALPWSAAEATSCNGGYYPSVKIGGEVTTAKTYTLTDLQAMTTSKLNVAFFSGSAGMQTYSFIGVPLLDLLNEAGIVTNSNQKNDILRKSLVVTSSDCYQVVVAMAELLPTFSGQQVMVAFADGDGTLLPSNQGMARLVVPQDKQGGRYASNIVSIMVRSPGPGPQTK